MAKLRKNLSDLSKQKIEVGHFKEQGKHSNAPYTYVELMEMHHRGANPEGTQTFTPRPIIDIARLHIEVAAGAGMFSKPVKQWYNGLLSPNANAQLLDTAGALMAKVEKDVFGKPPLIVTTNPTPMIDTGELRDATSHRNSKTKKIKRV